MKKIAIFTADDKVWFLRFWDRFIRNVPGEYEVAAIFVFRASSKEKAAKNSLGWFLRTMGLRATVIFCGYALKILCGNFFRGMADWRYFRRRYRIPVRIGSNPNDEKVARWLRDQNIAYVCVSINDILTKDVLHAVPGGFINKHSSLLPECRGLYPYLWGKIKGLTAGVSFHVMNELIDSGRPITCYKYRKDRSSMLRFYIDVYSLMAHRMVDALKCLEHGISTIHDSAIRGSYFGYPLKKDVRDFEACGGVLAQFRDIFYSPRRDVFE